MTRVSESEPSRAQPDPGWLSGNRAEQDLRALFGQSTAVFVSVTGPAHVLEAANEAFFTAFGDGAGARSGVPLAQLVPQPGFLALLDRVHRTGRTSVARDARMMLGAGSAVREAFFDFTCEPRLDAGGNVIGVRIIGVETTQVKQAQRLTTEHRALLEQIARQAPLNQVLEGMARAIEDLAPEEVVVSVLLADDDGQHLRHGAAPSLPDFYNRAIDGIAVGEGIGSCGTAAQRRQMVIVSDIAADPLWADFRDLAAAAGVAACWSTPILARDGTLLGTFAIYHRVPRSPQEPDFALARMFAGTAALAIERHQADQARLAAEAKEQTARNDLAFLLKASTALTSDLDYTQTLRRLAVSCVPDLAPLCAVDIADAGRILRVAAAAPATGQEQLLAAHIPVYDAEDNAVARVLASGLTEVARRTPAGPGPWYDLGVTGYLCVPLIDRGHAFGALTLLTTGDRAFDGHTVALAEELARRAAPAAVNARQYSQRTALARDLQAGLLLPGVPALPAAEAAVYYRPAGEGLEVGGDFYDIFPLPGGQWAFMLGDVCGRGALAATTTALVRHTARAVAPLLPGPSAVVQAVNKALLDRPESHGTGFVTMVYGHLAPAVAGGLDITLVRAGHPPPLHIDRRRAVHPLVIEGSFLGVTAKPQLTACQLWLEPAESLLLYTDGITEARSGEHEQFGEERLVRMLSQDVGERLTAPRVIETVIAAVRAFAGDGGTNTGDDQAILVLTGKEQE